MEWKYHRSMGGRVNVKAVLSRLSPSVCVVGLLFAFIWSTIVLVVLWPWLSFSVHGVLHTAFFTASTLLAAVSYARCVLSDAGSVPPGFAPDPDHVPELVEVKRKTGMLRTCTKCGGHKPPRTHHCRQCQACVLRMDHHCVWTNNCIGHRNHKVCKV